MWFFSGENHLKYSESGPFYTLFEISRNLSKYAKKAVIFRGGCSFYIKSKLKSEILNDKKIYKQKTFFSVITKNLNWESIMGVHRKI